jgi:hypothetical protein
MNFDNYLFRCSSLGKMMTYPNKDSLSAGPKTFLGQIFKEEFYGKTGQIQSKYLDKGLLSEEEAISMYGDFISKKVSKNTERYDNEYITGEPDINDEFLADIKCSWNHTTFPVTAEYVPNKDYYWQLQGYMALTDRKESRLVYCLVDTPDELIYDELKRVRSKLGVIELPEELEQEIWDSHKLLGIEPKHRIKEFVIQRNDEDIESIYKRVTLAREYLNTLTQLLT